MDFKRNESGTTRPKTLVFAIAALLLCSLALLVAQEFRIKEVKVELPDRVVIQYDSEANATYTLLQGSSVTNITTPVATNSS